MSKPNYISQEGHYSVVFLKGADAGNYELTIKNEHSEGLAFGFTGDMRAIEGASNKVNLLPAGAEKTVSVKPKSDKFELNLRVMGKNKQSKYILSEQGIINKTNRIMGLS